MMVIIIATLPTTKKLANPVFGSNMPRRTPVQEHALFGLGQLSDTF